MCNEKSNMIFFRVNQNLINVSKKYNKLKYGMVGQNNICNKGHKHKIPRLKQKRKITKPRKWCRKWIWFSIKMRLRIRIKNIFLKTIEKEKLFLIMVI